MTAQTTNSDSGAAIRVSPVTAGSIVLLISFFLPWISILGVGVAGYQLYEMWKPGAYLFVIPALAVGALALGFSGHKNMAIGQLAGGAPFVFLAIVLYESGSAFLESIAIGGYLTLASGGFLLCVAPRLGRKTRVQAVTANTGSEQTSHETEVSR